MWETLSVPIFLFPYLFERKGMSEEIHEFYAGWEPHWMFIGEVLDVEDKR